MGKKDIRVEPTEHRYVEDPMMNLAYRVIEQAIKDFKLNVRIYRYLRDIEERTEKQSKQYREACHQIGSCERFFQMDNNPWATYTGIDIEWIWTNLVSITKWKGLKNE